MASFANAGHPSQHYLMVRAEVAAQGFQHMSFTIELLVRFARRMAASARTTLQRWAAARRQAAQDRMFWELALADPRVMTELRAVMDHAESAGTRN
jgi:hypothetical protein